MLIYRLTKMLFYGLKNMEKDKQCYNIMVGINNVNDVIIECNGIGMLMYGQTYWRILFYRLTIC